VANYNPRDIVANIHRYLKNEEMSELHPWYRGFKGKLEYLGKDKYRVTGIINKIDDTTVEITELPLRTWTQSYKEQLEEWLQGTEKTPAWIKDYKEYHTDSSVNFIVTLSETQMAAAEKEGLESKFKLTSQISTTNMVCFDGQGRIRKYMNVNEILSDFCDVRKEYYQKRKEHLLNQLTIELSRLENKVRFVTEIIAGKLIVQNRKKVDLIQDLKSRGYDPMYKNKKDEPSEEEEESDKSDHGYDYLMSMPIWSLTMEKVQALNKDKQTKEAEVKFLIGQTIEDLWRSDLDAFLAQWDHFEKALSELEASRPAPGISVGKKGLQLKKPKAKKKAMMDSDEDMIIDDEDDDFAPKKKKVAVFLIIV
jgi:DNA topoisomerase-2